MALGTSGALVSGLAVVLTRTRRRTD
jgi:hypothetical protein